MTLDGRHVVVTGGGSGIGAAIAEAFAAEGAKVTVMGRSLGPLQEVADRIDGVAVPCDVTDRAALDLAMIKAQDHHGPAEIAIANAGTAVSMPFARTSVTDLADALAVNLTGVFNLWQAVLPGMRQAGWGRMIAIASTAGLKGYPYVATYVAAKHGVVGLTRALGQELAQTGITVNAICPGYVETPMLTRSLETIAAKTGRGMDDAAATLKKANPQNRFVQPDEVAAMAVWLAQDAARSLNGQALAIAGGEV